MQDQLLINTLFTCLFTLVVVNFFINLVMYFIHTNNAHKKLFLYWLSVAGVFLIQSKYQTGNLAVTLAYSASFVPVALLSQIAYQSIGAIFSVKRFALYTLAALCATVVLAQAKAVFSITAMPLALAIGSPFFKFAYLSALRYRQTTRLQKLLGVLMFATGIHSINFALFRMEPYAQLWGWVVAYALYDITGILMPTIALENRSIEGRKQLESLITERTESLNAANNMLVKSTMEKEELIKTLLLRLSGTHKELSLIRDVLENPSSQGDDLGASMLKKYNHSVKELEECLYKLKDFTAPGTGATGQK